MSKKPVKQAAKKAAKNPTLEDAKATWEKEKQSTLNMIKIQLDRYNADHIIFDMYIGAFKNGIKLEIEECKDAAKKCRGALNKLTKLVEEQKFEDYAVDPLDYKDVCLKVLKKEKDVTDYHTLFVMDAVFDAVAPIAQQLINMNAATWNAVSVLE